MAPSQTQNNNTQQHPNKSAAPRQTDYQDVDGSPGAIDWIANAIVMVVTFPVLFAAKVINPFVERGGAGIQALGAVAFLGGVIAGADNYYQMFTGKALLPWYTKADWVGDLAVQKLPLSLRWLNGIWGGQTFVGWAAVGLTLFSLGFAIAAVFSLTTQFIQGQAIRGRSVARAESEFKKWNAPTVPGKPNAETKLDMATVSWKELKRAGKNERSFMGFIALALWGCEVVSAFAAHNPLNYTGQAGQFIGCLIWALVTIAAGEIGYTIYVSAKEESRN